jgi:hypothetical protein
LRYLNGTRSYGIEYYNETRRSVSGYVSNFGGPMSWKSKRQPTVALSAVEAEYMALSSSVQEAVWIIALGTEIG